MTTTITPAIGTNVSLLQLGPGATGYGAIDWRRMLGATDLQEGALSGGGFKVTAGAGMSVSIAASTGNGAIVQGDTITNQGLYYVATHTAAIVETVTTAHATLPRIDQVILEVLDAQHDGGASNTVRIRIVNGTATAAATLDNRNGAAALPASAMRLADVLVPAAAVSILAANIRDRRQRARGAYRQIVRTAGSYTRASAVLAEIDSTNLKPRIECSGDVPLRVRLIGTWNNSTGAVATDWELWMDGAVSANQHRTLSVDNGGYVYNLSLEFEIAPVGGSHTFSIAFANGSGTLTVAATSTTALTMTVEEIVRDNSDNT